MIHVGRYLLHTASHTNPNTTQIHYRPYL